MSSAQKTGPQARPILRPDNVLASGEGWGLLTFGVAVGVNSLPARRTPRQFLTIGGFVPNRKAVARFRAEMAAERSSFIRCDVAGLLIAAAG
jgi:hypothetical protein